MKLITPSGNSYPHQKVAQSGRSWGTLMFRYLFLNGKLTHFSMLRNREHIMLIKGSAAHGTSNCLESITGDSGYVGPAEITADPTVEWYRRNAGSKNHFYRQRAIFHREMRCRSKWLDLGSDVIVMRGRVSGLPARRLSSGNRVIFSSDFDLGIKIPCVQI